MELNLKAHTILLLIGPNGCGKTTFVDEVIKPQVSEVGWNVKYLSSDDLRKDLLGVDEVIRDSKESLEVSGIAFDMLYNQLKMYTKFPVNSELVVIDTKGLSEEFRADILNIAKENHYNVDAVVFNYKSMGDYFKGNGFSKKVIESQLNKLRLKALRDLSLRKYNNVHVITKRDFVENSSDYKINFVDNDELKSLYLPEDNDYFVVGDIHERIDEFKSLLETSGFIIENNKIVGNERAHIKKILLVGDYLDKGNNTKETVEFIYSNQDWFYIVLGNHEDYVYRVLTGESKLWEGALKWFPSIPVLQDDEELRNKFFELINMTKRSYIIKKQYESTVYVTHSPCNKKYLGKLDSESKSMQTKFMVNYDKEYSGEFDVDLEKQLSWLKDEKDFNEPFHIFGHVATERVYRVGNRIGIDTGVSYGNKLTGVNIGRGKAYFYSVDSTKEDSKDLPLIFAQAQRDVNLEDLEFDEWKKINYALRNGINYVSGTMSPAEKDLEKGELESLEKGLEYFRSSNVDKVILQPKFMGSRGNVYLYKNVEESYGVSRNGFKIRHVDLTPIFNKLHERHIQFMKENNLNLMILDGELLPWAVLGKGLIEDSFKPLGNLVSEELSILTNYGFEEAFEKMKTTDTLEDFKIDRHKMNKKELSEKYGSKDYSTFKALLNYVHVDVNTSKELLEIYKEQVDIFGNVEKEAYFESFNILKMETDEGKTVFFDGDMEEIFTKVSDNDYLVIDFNDANYLEKAKDFYDTLTVDRKMEGVVIKPLVEKSGVVPYMKVRNENYLTLVYGYDYKVPVKYDRLINQKYTGKKMRTSLKEHVLSLELLKTNVRDISKDNKEYIKKLANVLLELREEGTIDPRL